MPQYLVNRFAEEIANGETELALVCSAELLRSTQNARKAGLKIEHSEDPGGEPTRIGDNRFGFSDEEARRERYSAERLATISDDNRWICFPYPRLMNSNAIIDRRRPCS